MLLAHAHQANAAKNIPGNEGALPFPTDLETNLFQRQLLTGGANEEEKPIGPGGNNFPKSEPPKEKGRKEKQQQGQMPKGWAG
ncbi:hypothetical protein WJX79_002671 [Trebouxia sp. C0005]